MSSFNKPGNTSEGGATSQESYLSDELAREFLSLRRKDLELNDPHESMPQKLGETNFTAPPGTVRKYRESSQTAKDLVHNKRHQEAKKEHEAQFVRHIPIAGRYDYWQRIADSFPYNKMADSHDEFLLRGISVHPRLSDYPQCSDVIHEYFRCQDQEKFLQMFNICAPIKEQLTSCLNEIFLKRTKASNQRGKK